MKRLILIAAIILVANCSFGQSLKKGNLVGLHVMTINLASGATMDQFQTFFISKVIPEYERQFQGAKGYLVKGVRGENNNSIAVMWVFDTEQSRDKYFTADGNLNDLGKATIEKVSEVDKELDKIGTHTDKYTDWVVQ
jgi:hypothetical protein